MTTPAGPVLVAGNWKLHLGPRAAEGWTDRVISGLKEAPLPPRVHLVAFPPALSLDAVARRLGRHLVDTGGGPPDAEPVAPASAASPQGLPDGAGFPAGLLPLSLGVQQIHHESSGAFTGENAAEMAREAGARWALAGHSERRTLFGEEDVDVVLRVQAAFRGGLIPLLCVGETLEERRGGRLEEVLLRQLEAVLSPPELREKVAGKAFALAYEPVWAIGTGETATPDDAAAAHALLRGHLVERLGEARGREIPILYGGSVKPSNARELLAAPEVGGVLVGGASLDPDDFLAIARAAAPG
jgi:triosephosphate isomerase